MNKKLLFSVVVTGMSCVAYSSAFISKSQSEVGFDGLICDGLLNKTCEMKNSDLFSFSLLSYVMIVYEVELKNRGL